MSWKILGFNNLTNCFLQLLIASLMKLLFEVTELDFELSIDQSSFLDESWIVPIFKKIELPPLQTLDIKVR